MNPWVRHQLQAIERAVFFVIVLSLMFGWIAIAGRYLWAPLNDVRLEQPANLQVDLALARSGGRP